MYILSDGDNVTGLYFKNQNYFPEKIINEALEKDSYLTEAVKNDLEKYFSGEDVSFEDIPLKLTGTPFRMKVWNTIRKIPYGTVCTYKDIAEKLGEKVSFQAVGGAVSHNPVSVIIPCHRVIGSDGSLVGYAGGLDKKINLLSLEGIITKIKRCSWVNPENEKYVRYHDEEWGRPQRDDKKLFEIFLLELFQAGLSWECVLNKRDAFRKAFDGFDAKKISCYKEDKIDELCNDSGIIRNRKKIEAAVINAGIFIDIQHEKGSFYNYIKEFCGENVIYENDRVSSELSDRIAADLKKRGMKFTGSITVYSFLQAVGVIYSHEKGCFLEHK